MQNMENWVCAEGRNHYNLDRDDFYNQLYVPGGYNPPQTIIINQNQEIDEETISQLVLEQVEKIMATTQETITNTVEQIINESFSPVSEEEINNIVGKE